MVYFITFLEGILTFISPCILPMIPVYITFLAGNSGGKSKGVIINAFGFVSGFSFVFVLIGALAGIFSEFFVEYKGIINVVGGIIIIFFGLNFADFINIKFLNKTKQLDMDIKVTGFFSAFVFGMIFSVGWTPCVGAFLGSALMQAASSGTFSKGIWLLACYCVGLGIPFMLSAVFLNQLQFLFNFIKKHYGIINKISGIFLVILGILMVTGLLDYYYAIFR